MVTAFVFAGGGSLGAIQVGALRELVRAGEQPDFVVGASVGALSACFFAARPDSAGVEALEGIWRGLRRNDVFPLTLSGALGWIRGAGSLFESTALRSLIERNLPLRNLEDAALPVHVVATNLSGAPVCLSRGAAVDAVLASAAIPIAFPSVRIGDDHLMDGAIAGNTPVLTAAELGATRIVVLQTGYACSIDGPPAGAVARGMHALTLLIANQMERAARQTRAWLDAGGLARATTPVDIEHNHAAMTKTPLAAGGYDVVSYFAEGEKPLVGSSEFTSEYEGKLYLFTDAVNRELFVAAPERYVPQYGGRCAYAMAHGSSVKGDPRVYQVAAGRLFFNLDARIHTLWKRDMDSHIRRADARWAAAHSRQEA